jgi:hypothetical protein
MVPELVLAITDWTRQVSGCLLIGGLAFSFWEKPRQTQDIDLLVLHPVDIPDNVTGFKRVRPHAFLHNKTHVEVEVVEPSTVNMSLELAGWIISQSVVDTSLGTVVHVANPSGITASKLGRWSMRDKADVDELMTHFELHLDSAPLPKQIRDRFVAFVTERGTK